MNLSRPSGISRGAPQKNFRAFWIKMPPFKKIGAKGLYLLGCLFLYFLLPDILLEGIIGGVKNEMVPY